jgi:hypothetical protein
MKQVLEELKTVPGVVGAFALDPKKGLLANAMPGVFKPDKLLEVSRQLLKIYSTTRMNFQGMQDISLHFDGSLLMLRWVSDQLFLALVCEPQVNTNMLGMSLNLAVEEMQARPTAAAPVAAAAFAEAPSGNSPEEIRNSGTLAAPLKKVEEVLSGIMGPMADMILEDAIDEWSRTGKASYETFSSLVKIICREVGDAQKAQEFQTLIGPYGRI